MGALFTEGCPVNSKPPVGGAAKGGGVRGVG